MNKFLKSLDITFRRDPSNFRPRINKLESVKDVEQKAAGNYFFMENNDDWGISSLSRGTQEKDPPIRLN